MKASMKLIAASALGKAIEAYGKRMAAADEDGHVLACSALAFASEHNDIRHVNRLFLVMGKGQRKAAMTSWFLSYGALSANTDKATKDTSPFTFDREKAWDIPGGQADPWFNHKPDPAPDEVLDVLKLVNAVIRKAKAPKEGQTVAHAGLIEKLEAIAAAGEGIAEGAEEPAAE